MKYGPKRFPKIIIDAAIYLTGKVKINFSDPDGRLNSKIDEKTMIELLEKKYGKKNVIEAPPRHWFDVKLYGHPIQIKSSDFSNNLADNISSKNGVLYALTTLSELKIDGVNKWKDFEKSLIGTRGVDNDRDLHIITLDKATGRVILTSLKSISVVVPNGNNLPFQINWKKNLKPTPRTHAESYDFLIDAYKQSVEKKISAHPFINHL
tara:strand:- start:304 stop:927 length:624 start_codon:yes stop_codon:yes gene_type:complete